MIHNPALLPKLRSPAILAAASGQPCALRLPGICNHNPATTVAAHLPGIGKGVGTKVSDLHVAFSCSACHAAIDHHAYEPLTDAMVLDAMLRGLGETQARLVGMGIITATGMRILK